MEDDKEVLLNRARKMIINGEDFEKITEQTGLRLKDLKRIQKEIENDFF